MVCSSQGFWRTFSILGMERESFFIYQPNKPLVGFSSCCTLSSHSERATGHRNGVNKRRLSRLEGLPAELVRMIIDYTPDAVLVLRAVRLINKFSLISTSSILSNIILPISFIATTFQTSQLLRLRVDQYGLEPLIMHDLVQELRFDGVRKTHGFISSFHKLIRKRYVIIEL